MANYRNPNSDSSVKIGDGIASASVGQNLTATGQAGYLFASGLNKPEVSDILSILYPQYSTTAILDRIGKSEMIADAQHSWFEQDRTRKGGDVVSATSNGSLSTFTITLDPANTGGKGGFLQYDQIMLWDGKTNAIVDSVSGTNNEILTVTTLDGSNPAAASGGERIGHLASAFGEYSSAPDSRKFFPDMRYQQLQVVRRSLDVSGKNLSDRTYIDNDTFFYKVEGFTMSEIAKDRENSFVFGQLSDQAALNPTCEGLLQTIFDGGIESTFTGAVDEDGIMEHIKDLVVSGGSGQEYTVFCGAQYFSDAQKALKPYYQSGGVNYGSFADSSTKVGINPEQYLFMGTLINFVHYAGFDDAEALPLPTAGATSINHSNFSMWLNMGTDDGGESYLSMLYKGLGSTQRKFIYKKEVGMTSDGEFVSNGDDGEKGHMLCETAPKLKCANVHGVHYAIG